MPCSTSAWWSSASLVLSSSATWRARSGDRPLSSYSVASSASSCSGCSSCSRPPRRGPRARRPPLVRGLGVLRSRPAPPRHRPSRRARPPRSWAATEAPAARRPSTTPAVAITPLVERRRRWARTVCRFEPGQAAPAPRSGARGRAHPHLALPRHREIGDPLCLADRQAPLSASSQNSGKRRRTECHVVAAFTDHDFQFATENVLGGALPPDGRRRSARSRDHRPHSRTGTRPRPGSSSGRPPRTGRREAADNAAAGRLRSPPRYLRAANYYSELPTRPTPPRPGAVHRAVGEAPRRLGPVRRPERRVGSPRRRAHRDPYEGTTLPGYFFRSGAADEPRRTLIYNNGSDGLS